MTKTLKWNAGLGVAVFAAGNVYAQEPVPGLQDLVGARGSSGEQALQDRGYTWIRTSKSANDSYTYWRDNENGQCIVVRTTDGRYASIVFASAFDCQAGAAHAPRGRAHFSRLPHGLIPRRAAAGLRSADIGIVT